MMNPSKSLFSLVAARNACKISCRNFTTSFRRLEEIRPPLQLGGLKGAYIGALWTSAKKENALPSINESMKKLGAIFEKSPSIPTLLQDPSLTSIKRAEIVELISKEVNSNSKIFKNFLNVLAENNRLGLISEAPQAFEELWKAAEGKVDVHVISAQELSKTQFDKLSSAIKNSNLLKNSKSINIIRKIDPKIMGGVIVEMGNKTIDLSVSSQVSQLNRSLLESV